MPWLLLLVSLPAVAQPAPLQQQIEAKLAEAGPGVRFGLVVVDDSGTELVAVNPAQRFVPGSNTKIFTSAAAYAVLTGLDQPDADGGARVRLDQGDVILEGRGDARLSSAPDCTSDCLAALADAVAATTRRVRDVIGDDTRFPDERWSAGMSWNNIPSDSGTAISALTLDDNELLLTVTPGAAGQPPQVAGLPYYTIDNRVVTGAPGSRSNLDYDRLPFERRIRLTGTIAADAPPRVVRLGIDDPAAYAAWRLAALLEARGVKVKGKPVARHRDRPGGDSTIPATSVSPAPLAALVPPPLQDDLVHLVRDSQNLHAELLLRRLGLLSGAGSVADGLMQVEALAAHAALPRSSWDLADGSGMSTYNRVTPRAMVALLRWIGGQPWGATWRGTLATGGVDGTIARRFKGSALEGKVFAKTGTLNATNALAGYLIARSGRTLTFALFANDVPSGARATPVMDAALIAIAEAN
jgi:D-alanyl-D-alanine carboxypeptidase/D-alanyl-D-alanine-endopeptidase (penicillin-binding protein 4)